MPLYEDSVTSIAGTTNRISADQPTGDVTLTTPQDIHTGATPTFVNVMLSGLTQGTVVFVGASGILAIDTVNFLWDDTANQLVLGGTATNGDTNTTGATLLVTNNSATPLAMRRFSNNANGPAVRLVKGRGTSATPLRAKTNDVLLNLNGIPYVAADDVTTASESANAAGNIRVVAAEDQTASSSGGYITFGTRAIGSATSVAPTERVRIDSSGASFANLTSGRVPFASTNGLLTDDADFTFATDTLTATKLAATTSIAVGGGTAITALDAGTYTPTLTNDTNIDASTAYECQYLRVGNTVTVSGRADLDPTGAGVVTLAMSLPVASNFGAVEDCAGIAVSATSAAFLEPCWINADPTNNRAEMKTNATDVANRAYLFTFTYQVI